MKTGVVTVPLYVIELAEALVYLKSLGVEAVELGVGGFPGNIHCNAEKLLKTPELLRDFKKTILESGIEISAFSCHGNPVHPDPEVALKARYDYQLALTMAAEMGVKNVVTFSGCPGDSNYSKRPNWVTCPWPEDYSAILDYQWDEVLIPYWEIAAQEAEAHGVHVCLEMHPGFCVYNPETLLRLRNAVGPAVGANLDPSHLFWQGINPSEAIRELKDALYYFHAKDVRIQQANVGKNGVLDTKHYCNTFDRSWTFCTIGYGHDRKTWCDIVAQLRNIGYNGVLSIEHEDSLMSVREGLEKAVEFVNSIKIADPPCEMWWA